MAEQENIREEQVNILPDRQKMDRAIGILQASKDLWRGTPLVERIQLLEKVIRGFSRVSEAWVRLSCEAKGIAFDEPVAGEEWLAGPYTIMRHLRLLKTSLQDLEKRQAPQFPAKPKKGSKGTWQVPVFPTDIYDSLFFRGTRAEIWLTDEANSEDVHANTAHAYRRKGTQRKD